MSNLSLFQAVVYGRNLWFQEDWGADTKESVSLWEKTYTYCRHKISVIASCFHFSNLSDCVFSKVGLIWIFLHLRTSVLMWLSRSIEKLQVLVLYHRKASSLPSMTQLAHDWYMLQSRILEGFSPTVGVIFSCSCLSNVKLSWGLHDKLYRACEEANVAVNIPHSL